MTPSTRARWRPLVAAFVVWFLHFMLCWVAVELWPGHRLANASAWGLTAVALLCLGVHAWHLQRRAAQGELSAWTRRLGQGATALAGLAVVFTAVPSMVFVR